MTMTATAHPARIVRYRPLWIEEVRGIPEAAKDARDGMVISACRRVITTERLGWKKHGNPIRLKLIGEFAN